MCSLPFTLGPIGGALGPIIVAVRGTPLSDMFGPMRLVPMFVGSIPSTGTRISVWGITLSEGGRGGQDPEKTERSETHFALRFSGAREKSAGPADCYSVLTLRQRRGGAWVFSWRLI